MFHAAGSLPQGNVFSATTESRYFDIECGINDFDQDRKCLVFSVTGGETVFRIFRPYLVSRIKALPEGCDRIKLVRRCRSTVYVQSCRSERQGLQHPIQQLLWGS